MLLLAGAAAGGAAEKSNKSATGAGAGAGGATGCLTGFRVGAAANRAVAAEEVGPPARRAEVCFTGDSCAMPSLGSSSP